MPAGRLERGVPASEFVPRLILFGVLGLGSLAARGPDPASGPPLAARVVGLAWVAESHPLGLRGALR